MLGAGEVLERQSRVLVKPNLMKTGFAPLRDMPAFVTWFSRFSPDGFWGSQNRPYLI